MGIKTFNIDDEAYEQFKNLYQGDMSKIINDFIASCADSKAIHSQDIAQMESELNSIQKNIRELKTKSYKLALKIDLKKEQMHEKENKKSKEDEEIEMWANEIIADAEQSGQIIDLKLEAEGIGKSVKDMLIERWKEAKK